MYLFGSSGHCKVIIDIIIKSNLEILEGVFDDNPSRDEICKIPVYKTPSLDFFHSKSLIISIGDNENRKKIANQITTNFLTAIHPNAVLAYNVSVGEGTVVMAGALLSSDVIVGKHCIINTASVVEHDCVLSDFVHISPNAALAGNVIVGEGTQVGIGAIVIQGVKIGNWVTIGAGAVIINDVPDHAVIVGNPGKIIKFNNQNE